MLDQTPLQLDRERIKELREVEERGGGSYSREAINQGMAIIQGNTVNVGSYIQGRSYVAPKIVLMNLLFES